MPRRAFRSHGCDKTGLALRRLIALSAAIGYLACACGENRTALLNQPPCVRDVRWPPVNLGVEKATPARATGPASRLSSSHRRLRRGRPLARHVQSGSKRFSAPRPCVLCHLAETIVLGSGPDIHAVAFRQFALEPSNLLLCLAQPQVARQLPVQPNELRPVCAVCRANVAGCETPKPEVSAAQSCGGPARQVNSLSTRGCSES